MYKFQFPLKTKVLERVIYIAEEEIIFQPHINRIISADSLIFAIKS